VSVIVESVIVESVVSEVFSDEQAATDKEIAKAKKPNLNRFFILFCFYDLTKFHGLIPVSKKGNPSRQK